MHPITHLLGSWCLAEIAGLDARDRTLVTAAGVVPDIDGLGILAETATSGWPEPLAWWSEYHHVLCHNVGFAVLVAGIAAVAAVRRAKTVMLALVAFHLHLLGDLVGSRGPDGYMWPIPYLLPFSRRWQWSWDGQWELNAWPNISLTIVLLVATMLLAWKRGRSPVGLVSSRADRAFVAALRNRFGTP